MSKNNIFHSDKRGYLKYLQFNDLIEHIRLDVRNRENFRKGIRQVSEDSSYDTKCIDQLIKNETFGDGNLSRQLGDAGEYLLTMFLGQQKKFKVARVDHVGADLIAADSEGNRYAISVKTRQNTSYEFYELYTTGRSIKAPKRELGKLKDFADKYNMIPVVACIFVKSNFGGMDVYISSLDNWIKEACANSNKAICFTPIDESVDVAEASLRWKETMKTFKISISKPQYQEYLNNANGIEHIEIDFVSAFNPKMQWK